MFDDDLHTMSLSADGSYTAYSKEYKEHYHSTKDGALHESLVKHVEPAMRLKEKKDELFILDICFGLGFNTLATLYYHKKHRLKCKLNIYSPELDATLVNSLTSFEYPKEFDSYKNIILELSRNGIYKDETVYIELFVGDAREYIKKFSNKFDIVYQDAFSPSVNPILWTKEYFEDIKKVCLDDAVLTTYSIALKIRLALYENDFILYINEGENSRASTVASCVSIDTYKKVDMEHKISCNEEVKSLRDSSV